MHNAASITYRMSAGANETYEPTCTRLLLKTEKLKPLYFLEDIKLNIDFLLFFLLTFSSSSCIRVSAAGSAPSVMTSLPAAAPPPVSWLWFSQACLISSHWASSDWCEVCLSMTGGEFTTGIIPPLSDVGVMAGGDVGGGGGGGRLRRSALTRGGEKDGISGSDASSLSATLSFCSSSEDQ